MSIKSLNGKLIEIQITNDMSIYDLKKMIEKIEGCPPHQDQILLYRNNSLKDSKTVSHYNLCNDPFLTVLVLKLKKPNLFDSCNKENITPQHVRIQSQSSMKKYEATYKDVSRKDSNTMNTFGNAVNILKQTLSRPRPKPFPSKEKNDKNEDKVKLSFDFEWSKKFFDDRHVQNNCQYLDEKDSRNSSKVKTYLLL